MTFDEYQKESTKTALYSREHNQHLYYLTLGLVGEAGEIANKIKKIIRDENGVLSDEKRELVKGELGDVLWYMSQLATEMGLSFDTVAAENLKKLFSRLERGKIQGSGDTR